MLKRIALAVAVVCLTELPALAQEAPVPQAPAEEKVDWNAFASVFRQQRDNAEKAKADTEANLAVLRQKATDDGVSYEARLRTAMEWLHQAQTEPRAYDSKLGRWLPW